MSDIGELVKRAKRFAVDMRNHRGPPETCPSPSDYDMEDIADAFEAQAAELTRLREQCEAKDAEIERLRRGLIDTADRMEEARKDYEAYCADLGCATIMEVAEKYKSSQVKVASLSAENERLRKALDDAQRAAQLAERRENTSRKFWIRDAKEALAGKPQALRNRVELFESPENEMRVVLSGEALAAHVGEGEKDGLE